MSEELKNCSTCSSIAERAKLINDLIKNQHELVSSLINERRASSSARTIVAELKRQNEFLSQECNKISEEYKIALEKVSPLEKRTSEIESELNAKKIEIESYRVQLEIASNAPPKVSTDAESRIAQMQHSIDKLESKVRRQNTQQRQCTRALKNLIRMKPALDNEEAVRSIETLETALGVSLDPLEQQAIEIERILQNESDPGKKIVGKTDSTSAESSSQTESMLRTHRMCQTSALSMRSRECQTETASHMPMLECGVPLTQSEALSQIASEGPSDAQEPSVDSVSVTSPTAMAQDSSTQDSDLRTTPDVDSTQLAAAAGGDRDNKMTNKRPVSLLECIPSISVVSDSEDPTSPIPECSLVPRKIEKHVTFRDDETFAPIEPAAAAETHCGDEGPKDVFVDDPDAKLMQEVEMILAEMCNPFGDPNQRLLAVSPMPPSPVPTRRKKKKKKDRTDLPKKRLIHQNSIGFEPSEDYLRDIVPSSPVFAAPQERSSLKAEVTHNPDVGLTTFSFQMPTCGTSKLSLEFDQITKHVTLSCADQNVRSHIGPKTSAPDQRNSSNITAGDVLRRPSFGFPVPPEAPRALAEPCVAPQPSKVHDVPRIKATEARSQRSFANDRKHAGDNGGMRLSVNDRTDSVESCREEAECHVSHPLLSEMEEEPQNRESQAKSSPPSFGANVPSTRKKDYRLKRLSKLRKSEPLVKEFQRNVLRKSIDANIMEAKEKMLQRRIQLAPQVDSDEIPAQVSQSEPELQSKPGTAEREDRSPTGPGETRQVEVEDLRGGGCPETNATSLPVEQGRIQHVQVDGAREEPQVEVIVCGSESTVPWGLRTWDGKEHVATDFSADDKESEDEEAAMCIVFEEEDVDDFKTPLSPPEHTVVDRSCTKVIPTEFIEEIHSNVSRTPAKSKPTQRSLTPPTSPPPPVSGGSPMITRGKSKLIPSSPINTSSIDGPNTRKSSRLSTKVGEIPAPLMVPTSPVGGKAQSTPSGGRVNTRNVAKIVSLLKDTYVPETVVYEADDLFSYDDVKVVKEAPRVANEQAGPKRDSMQTIVGYFKQKDGRFASIEGTLRKVADNQVTMNDALSEIENLEHLRKLYVSFIYVLLDVNKKLEVQTESQVTDTERNLVTFFLEYVPQMKKYEGKTNHCIGFNCINFIRAYLMSPDRSNRAYSGLASLWKVISYVASKIQGETLQLVDEIYYAVADRSSEAAYTIGCILAGWPQCLEGIKVDSPFGFVVRYVLFHHTSTVPLDDLQTARAMAIQAGWAPLIQEEHSLAQAIERFSPAIFSKESETKFLSRLALQSLEVMLILLGDVNRAMIVIEEYVPNLLRVADLPDRDVNSLLQLCGKIWSKFAHSPLEKIPFEATVESLIDLKARLKDTDRKDVQEFCSKALWSYAKYDSSEVGSRARQLCTQGRIVQSKAVKFSRGGRGANASGKRGKKPSTVRRKRKRKTRNQDVAS